MAQYYRVSPNFWKGRRDWSDREKLLAQYLLSCPHRNLEGLYWLPLAYVEADLGWPAKVLRACLATLERDSFAAYDETAQVLFLCKALSFQAPTTEKQVTGALNSLERVPKTVLWDRFVDACERWAPKLSDELGNPSGSDTQSHSNEIPMRSESHPDIARTLNSNSNSYSNSRPPDPPRGGRVRDREKWEKEFAAWLQAHPVTPELLEEWEPARISLAEVTGDQYVMSQLGLLHPHSFNDGVWLLGGPETPTLSMFRHLSEGSSFKTAVGFDWELVTCRCELSKASAA
jgi:hypothetical protein